MYGTSKLEVPVEPLEELTVIARILRNWDRWFEIPWGVKQLLGKYLPPLPPEEPSVPTDYTNAWGGRKAGSKRRSWRR